MADSSVVASADDELIKQPWKCHKIGNDFFIIKYRAHPDGFKILVSDGINLWSENLSKSEIQSRHDSLNTTVESPVDQILLDVENTVEHLDTVSVSVERAEKRMKLNCESKSDEPAPFVWNFQLSDDDNTMFADHLTFPFVSMMIEQEARVQQLCRIIAEKDNEILQYKLSGATLTRARSETKKFDQVNFIRQTHSAVDEFGNSCPVELLASSDSLQSLYRLMTERVRLTNRATSDSADQCLDISDAVSMTSERPKEDLNENDSQDLHIKRRAALKKRLMENDRAKEEKRKQTKIIKL